VNNIYVLNKSYGKIGTLSNQGANPQAPYYDDLYTQELDTGADTYQFSTTSSTYTQDLLEIGNHIMFAYKNRNELFTITSLEYSHYEGYKTIGVYAEGIGFDLLEVFMEKPSIQKNPGNDSDGDDDDDYDDEYGDPDDVWIDENGNIVYIKNRNENGDDYGSPDDVWIDEDGNICYKKNRNNRDNDSLEFKNISYSTFLNVLLKDTGWSYVCQPGLESEKHDINIRYDTNIYAILQDSIQAYEGIELEFVHEMNGNSVQKIIKAYKNGGRGSFVGKRFEYGTNVKGITKTQKVTDSEDDTVIHIGNIGVDVTYDIDFALKSAEVPEIEIGDTHYVIDNSFYPSMNIEARIGKIEVSFSDPTKNKIYVANFKKIAGSTPDNLDGDNIEDIIDDKLDDYLGDGLDDIIDDKIDDKIGDGLDDYLDNKIGEGIDDKIDEYLDDKIGEGIDDKIDEYLDSKIGEGIDEYIDNYLDDKIGEGLDGYLGEHTHDKLVHNDKELVFSMLSGSGNDGNRDYEYDHVRLTANDFFISYHANDYKYEWADISIDRTNRLIGDNTVNSATVFTDVSRMIPKYDNVLHIGSPEYRWAGIYSNYIDAANSVNSPRYFGYNYQVRFDRDDMRNVTKVTDKQDLLDFIINKVNVYKYSSKEIDDVNNAPDDFPYQEYYGLLAEDFTTHNSGTDCGGSEIAYNIIKALITDDTNNDGEQNQNDGHNKHTYNLPALVTALIGAFQQHVENGDDGDSGGENGGGDHSKCAEKEWVEEWCSNLELADKEMYKRLDALEAGGGSNIDLSAYATKKYVDDAIDAIEISGGGISDTVENLTVTDTLKTTKITEATRNTGVWFYSKLIALYDTIIEGKLRVYGGINVTQGDSSFKKLDCTSLTINGVPFGGGDGDTDSVLDTLTVRKIQGPEPEEGQYNWVTFEDGIKASHINCPEHDSNQVIFFGNNVSMHNDLSVHGNIVMAESDCLVETPKTYTNSIYPYERRSDGSSYYYNDLGIDFSYKTINNGNTSSESGQLRLVASSGDVLCIGDLWVGSAYRIYGTLATNSDRSLKENIRYIDDLIMTTSNDCLEKTDLHDFIVNQINLCEFNYIGNESDKIGFIANEYEGTKVGDKIVSRQGEDNLLTYDLNNLVFATIGALQEEARIKDEKIANLEARIARLEEMLNNN
jgi:hypothetical protein